jgi:O-antigen/teichoic acid export membrane protein
LNASTSAVGPEPDAVTLAQAPPPSGMITQVARGTAWSMAGTGLLFLVSLSVTPFTIRLFGPVQYGIWALINVVISYMGFADFGMSPASTRYASEAFSKGDTERERAVIWTSALMGLATTAVFVGGLYLLAPLIVHDLLRVPTEYAATTIAAVRLAGLIMMGRVLAGVFNTCELVRLRMGVFNAINSAGAISQVALVPLVLWKGGGLVAAVAVAVAVAFAMGLAHLFVAGMLLPGFFHVRIARSLVAPLFVFGVPLVFSFCAEVILSSSEKLVLAHFTSPVTVAHYAVAFSFAGFLAAPSLALSQSLLPAFSRLAADSEQLANFYARTMRACLYWLAPAALGAALLAKTFISLWAGQEYGSQSVLPAYILIVGVSLDCFSYIASRLLLGLNRSKTLAQASGILLLPYLLLVTVLTLKFGIVGAAAAWSLRAAANLFFLTTRARKLMTPVPWLNRPAWLVVALSPLFLSFLAFEVGVLRGGFGVHLVAAVFSALIYAAILWTKVLGQDERAWFLRASGIGKLVAGASD